MGKNVLTLPGAVAAEPDVDMNDSGLVRTIVHDEPTSSGRDVSTS